MYPAAFMIPLHFLLFFRIVSSGGEALSCLLSIALLMEKRWAMADLLFLTLGIGFFAVSLLGLSLCKKL
jgi:hypothetical protein